MRRDAVQLLRDAADIDAGAAGGTALGHRHLAPDCAASRAARTPPLPAPMTIRSTRDQPLHSPRRFAAPAGAAICSPASCTCGMPAGETPAGSSPCDSSRYLLIIVLVLGAILFGGGMLLSPKFTIVRSVDIQAPAAAVYPLVADPRRWQRMVGLEPARSGDADELQRRAGRRRRRLGLAQRIAGQRPHGVHRRRADRASSNTSCISMIWISRFHRRLPVRAGRCRRNPGQLGDERRHGRQSADALVCARHRTS